MYSLGAKLFVVCAGPGQVSNLGCERRHFIFSGEICHYATSQPSTWGDQRGARTIFLASMKQISGTVAGDSSLQDRGVAHYLLSFIFSLVSLLFSLYICVPYQKYQKYLLPCFLLLPWVPVKTPSV